MENTIIICAILLGVCQIVCCLGLTLLIRLVINAKQAEIEARAEAALREWVVASEGQASKAAMLVSQVGTVVGDAAAKAIMRSLKQDVSSTAQVANGISEPLMAQTNPILALLTGGKRGRGSAVVRLAELLGPMLLGAKGGQGEGNGKDNEPRQGSFTL